MEKIMWEKHARPKAKKEHLRREKVTLCIYGRHKRGTVAKGCAHFRLFGVIRRALYPPHWVEGGLTEAGSGMTNLSKTDLLEEELMVLLQRKNDVVVEVIAEALIAELKLIGVRGWVYALRDCPCKVRRLVVLDSFRQAIRYQVSR